MYILLLFHVIFSGAADWGQGTALAAALALPPPPPLAPVKAR